MAQVVLGVAGAVVGGAFGMPGVGYMLGSALGAALFPEPGQDGPRLSDLKVQQSQYGAPIPILYGTYRVAGNVIWAADLIEHAQEADSGSGGGGPTNYTYTCSFAVSLCEGPIAGVRRIWADNKLIYDLTADSANPDVMFKAGGYMLYLGDEDQLPDATMESYKGVGNVPAYRGQAYWVFTDLELGKYGNRLPNLTFEVVTKGAEGESSPAVRLGSGGLMAQDPNTGYIWTGWRSSGGALPTPYMGPASQVEESFFIEELAAYVLVYDIDTMSLVHAIRLAAGGVDLMNVVYYGHDMYVSSEGNSYNSVDVIYQINPVTYAIVGQGDTSYAGAVSKLGLLSRDSSSLYISVTNGLGDGNVQIQSSAPYAFISGSGESNGDWVYHYAHNPVNNVRVYTSFAGDVLLHSSAADLAIDVSSYFSVSHLSGGRAVIRTGTPFAYIAAAGSKGLIMIHTGDGTVQEVLPKTSDSVNAIFYSPDTDILYVDYGPLKGVTAYNGETFAELRNFPDSGYAAGQSEGNAIYIGNETFVVSESTSLPQGRIWVISLGASLAAEKIRLSEIVADVSYRCGLASIKYDVRSLTALVDGYGITSNMSGRAAIEPLAQAYFFDSVESDGKVKFVTRGGPSVVSIPMSNVLMEGK